LHWTNGYKNAPQRYVLRTWPVMFLRMLRSSLVSIIPPMFHTAVYVKTITYRLTSERRLGNFKENYSFEYRGVMDRKVLSRNKEQNVIKIAVIPVMKIYYISVFSMEQQLTRFHKICAVPHTKLRAHYSHSNHYNNTPHTAVRPSTEPTRDCSYQQPQETGEGIKHVKWRSGRLNDFHA